MKKFTRLTAVLFFIAGNCIAQFNPVWYAQFQHTTTPGYSNEGRRIAEDGSGNIFMLSDATSDIDAGGLTGTTTHHYVTLTKYSSTGTLLLSKFIEVGSHIISGYNNLNALGLEIDAAGNIYIGYSIYFANTDLDVTIEKYNNNLSRIWGNTYQQNGVDVLVDFKLNAGGTVYAVMKSVNGPNTTYSVIKSIPSIGFALLVTSWSPNTAIINSIALDGAQSAYVGGSVPRGGYKNAYVAKINLTSNTITWTSSYIPKGINGDNVVNKIVVGVDGNIYSTGTSYQGPSKGDQVLVLSNLPGNAKFNYILLLGNSIGSDKGLFITATEPGWLYIASTSQNDVVVYRFQSSGAGPAPAMSVLTPIPHSSYTAVTSISLSAMKTTPVKNVYVTGTITATGPSGGFSCAFLEKFSVAFGNALIHSSSAGVEGDFNNNYQAVDISLDAAKTDVYWLRNNWTSAHANEFVELSDLDVPSPLRESVKFNTAGNIFVVPNPASGRTTFQSEENIMNIEIMDVSGNIVLKIPSASRQVSVDISSLTAGIYICKVSTENGEQVKRLVVN